MSILESILGAGSAVGGGMLVKDAYDKLGQIGMDARRGADEISLESLQQTAFNPYSVQTATGANFGVGPSGSVTMAVSPQEQAIQDAALAGAQGMLSQATGDTGAREQSIYVSALYRQKMNSVRLSTLRTVCSHRAVSVLALTSTAALLQKCSLCSLLTPALVTKRLYRL